MEEKIMTREQVEEQNTWNLGDLFSEDAEWEKGNNELSVMCKELSEWKGRTLENSDTLYEFLELFEKAGMLAGRVYVYAHQKYHQDTTNPTYQGMSERATAALNQFSSAIAFFQPEVLTLEQEEFNNIFDHCKARMDDKRIAGFERYFSEIFRQKEHSLSGEMEELLANARESLKASDSIFSMFNNADIKFPVISLEDGKKVEITHGRYSSLLKSQDRRVRKEAFEGLHGQYKRFENTLATTYGANVKSDIFYAKTRKYPSALAMALDESHIPEEVYTNLIQVVRENLSVLHRYMKVRKNALGVEALHLYDVYVPMVEGVDEKISFEQAKEMVLDGLKPMGEEYLKLLQEGFSNRWIDVYENAGKRSGAYSWGCYGVHPYVLLNHQDDLNSVFTLAHEMGHALHSYYSNKNQPYVCADYEIFVAEVASTCNEALLIHDLLEKTEDKKKKAYLLNYYLEQFRTTLFRQTMFAEFEWKAHEMAEKGEALTAETLNAMYHQLNVDYFGEETVIDEAIDVEWARIPHFYNSFYVYQYATGYSAAIALSAKILKEGMPAVNAYIGEFLCKGGSKDPIDLLKGAGVDLSKKEPIQAAMDVCNDLLDQIEELL